MILCFFRQVKVRYRNVKWLTIKTFQVYRSSSKSYVNELNY